MSFKKKPTLRTLVVVSVLINKNPMLNTHIVKLSLYHYRQINNTTKQKSSIRVNKTTTLRTLVVLSYPRCRIFYF